jgi:hypothetical protein
MAETKFRESRGNVHSQLPARKKKVVTVHRHGLEERKKGGHVTDHDLQRP